MKEIKTLERIIEQYEECKRNCEEFTVNSTALYREEYEAIENLINQYKELRNNYKNLLSSAEILKEASEEQEKMIELMNEYILKNCVSLEICSKQIGKECYIDVIYGDECKDCILDYFRKKAKGE